MKIGKGPKGLIILENINSEQLTWVSADGVFLVTRNGRITKTAGLNNNLIDFNGPEKSKKYLLNELDGTLLHCTSLTISLIFRNLSKRARFLIRVR